MSIMKKSAQPDPFEKSRVSKGYEMMNDQDDPVMMILRHKDVRRCAFDWKTFSSQAKPGRIVVPSEVNIRDTRQIPFELDPPLHTEYRALVEEWFRRPLLPDYQEQLENIIEDCVEDALERDSIEIVSEFSLPLQSRALTLLLNTPNDEVETWISWGTHVFRSEDTNLDGGKAEILYSYIDQKIEEAIKNPGEDLYSVLLASQAQGRTLTKEEVKGVMILTFAGGRDTIINAVTNTIGYFAEHPKSLDKIREQPKMLGTAVEELIRYFTPLTHMGRVATNDTEVCDHAVKANTRISLCWASANRDAEVFEDPDEIILDRKKNPHLGFGFKHHKCLGAPHARQILKTLMIVLTNKVKEIEILEHQDNIEEWGPSKRKVGYDKLKAKFTGL